MSQNQSEPCTHGSMGEELRKQKCCDIPIYILAYEVIYQKYRENTEEFYSFGFDRGVNRISKFH